MKYTKPRAKPTAAPMELFIAHDGSIVDLDGRPFDRAGQIAELKKAHEAAGRRMASWLSLAYIAATCVGFLAGFYLGAAR